MHKDKAGDVYVALRDYTFHCEYKKNQIVRINEGDILVVINPVYSMSNGWFSTLLLTAYGDLVICGHPCGLYNSAWCTIIAYQFPRDKEKEYS